MAKITGQVAVMPDGKTKCFVGLIAVSDLLAHVQAAQWQAFEIAGIVATAADLFRRGYQRLVDKTRVPGMVKGLANGGYFFGSLILNIRPQDMCDVSGISVKGKPDKGGSMEIGPNVKLWLIDGQQRTAALRNYCEIDPKFGKTKVFVQVFFDNDERFEGRAFLLLNIGKIVPLDLQERLAQCWNRSERQAIANGELPGIDAKLGRKLADSAQCCDIIDALRFEDPFLHRLIRTPNAPNDTIPLRQHSFVRSLIEARLFLCPMFGDSILSEAGPQARIIHTFWSAVREVWPQPFEETGLTSRQRQYSLISAVCFISMHKLLHDILRSWEGPFTVERLVPLLRRMSGGLNLRFWRDLRPGDPMIGNAVEFWSSMNPMIRHKGNTEVVKELYTHLRDALAGDSSVETVVKLHTCGHYERRGVNVDVDTDPQAAVA